MSKYTNTFFLVDLCYFNSIHGITVNIFFFLPTCRTLYLGILKSTPQSWDHLTRLFTLDCIAKQSWLVIICFATCSDYTADHSEAQPFMTTLWCLSDNQLFNHCSTFPDIPKASIFLTNLFLEYQSLLRNPRILKPKTFHHQNVKLRIP